MKINKYIKEIGHTVTVAGLNYDIWWTYKKKKYRKILLYIDDFYPLFFKASIHAHFVAVVVSLYLLFETRTDTINFFSLLDLLEKSGKFSNKDISSLRCRINTLKPLWIKISILRNNVFGHIANNLYIDPWKEARISPNNIDKLIKKCQKLLNDISCKWDGTNRTFYLSAKDDTRNLLKDLRTHNTHCIKKAIQIR